MRAAIFRNVLTLAIALSPLLASAATMQEVQYPQRQTAQSANNYISGVTPPANSDQFQQTNSLAGGQPTQQQLPEAGSTTAGQQVQPAGIQQPQVQQPQTNQAQTAQGQIQQPQQVETFQLTGRFQLAAGTQTGYLILQAAIPQGSYIYSMTNAQGPPPTTVTVTPGEAFRTGESFAADRAPYIVEHDEIFECRLEKHYQLVQFFVPIEIAQGVDPSTIRPEINFNGQICSDEGFCMPLNDKVVAAEFAGYFQPQVSANQEQTQQQRR